MPTQLLRPSLLLALAVGLLACTGAGFEAARGSLLELPTAAAAPPPADPSLPLRAAAAPPATPDNAAPPHMHYQCPMDPQVQQSTPGRCPICEMRLVLVNDAPPAGSADDAKP